MRELIKKHSDKIIAGLVILLVIGGIFWFLNNPEKLDKEVKVQICSPQGLCFNAVSVEYLQDPAGNIIGAKNEKGEVIKGSFLIIER